MITIVQNATLVIASMLSVILLIVNMQNVILLIANLLVSIIVIFIPIESNSADYHYFDSSST